MSLPRAERERLRAIAAGRAGGALRLLEGPKAVRDALRTGAVVELWLRAGDDDEGARALRAEARAAGLAWREASARDLERLGRTVTPQGALAVVRDTAVAPAEVLARPGLVLWLDGVQDPGNVGALMRVAAAFGAAGVLVSHGGADPLGLKALRASAGLALAVPFARDAPEALAAAAVDSGRDLCLLEADGEELRGLSRPPRRPVLVVGSEGRGAGPAARAAAGRRLGLRLAPGVDSLNAAVAAGIAVALLTAPPAVP